MAWDGRDGVDVDVNGEGVCHGGRERGCNEKE